MELEQRIKAGQRAYDFIMTAVTDWVMWASPVKTEEQVADRLNIPVNVLRSLKDGDLTPLQKLNAEMKQLLPIDQARDINRLCLLTLSYRPYTGIEHQTTNT